MKKVISLLLTALMAFSVATVGAVSASAVEEDPEIAITAGSHIFFDNTNTQWTDVYFYAWNYGYFGDSVPMEQIGNTNVYEIVVPQDVPDGAEYFLFKSAPDWSGQQTANQTVETGKNTYTPVIDETGAMTVTKSITIDSPTTEVAITPYSKSFTGSIDVTVYAFNTGDATATYQIGDAAPVAFTSPTTITLTSTATVTVEKIKITASIVAAGADFQIKVAFENTDNEGKTEGFVKLGDAVKSQDIVVEYTSKLNESAVIGTPGNPNEVNMKFSNNPNLTDDSEEGETPKDKVVVFTYEIKALKVEPDGSAIDQTAYDALSDTEKANYVKVGDKWQKTKPLATAGFTLFKKVDASNLTDEQKSGVKSEYEKATKKGDVVKDGSDYYIAVKDEIKGTDTFEFEGTDAGAYKLVETTVPSGYNKAEDITITVAATYDTKVDNPKLKTLTVTPEEAGFTVTTTIEGDDQHITTDGIISGKILNEKGSVLPSTGGIGTTIFYVLGGLLIFGAGIVLVARRKASE